MILRDIGWEGVDWILLAQNRDWWRVLINAVMNLLLLLLRWLYSPMRTFASLMDFSQSSLSNRSDCSEATS
jgi:hypothetical protein